MRKVLVGVVAAAALALAVLPMTNAHADAGTSHRYVVVLKDGADPGATARDHGRRFGAQVTDVYSHALKGYAASIPDGQLANVRNDPAIEFVSPDRDFAADGRDPGFPGPAQQLLTRDIRRIGGDASSTRSGDGKGAVDIDIAILDSGIDVDHPDLNVVGGAACNGSSYDDDNGHGSHVAGSAAARDNAVGLAGVAPGTRLWAVKVLDKNLGGKESQVICGLDWVTATRQDPDSSNDVDVVNLSLGSKGTDDGACGRTNDDALHAAVCRTVSAGVTIVAAAGNAAVDLGGFVPAAYDEVLTVTAMTDTDGVPGGVGPVDGCLAYPDDTPAAFSNFATSPADSAHTVAAPGVCISSAWWNGLYNNDSGTSMASPHAAGLVALCMASRTCAGRTPAQIVARIVSDATAYSGARRNAGYGFTGDPLHPIAGKYYGYLIRASLY